MTISCTYRFDQRRAAAHSSRANDNTPAYQGKEEAIWKWHDPPSSPLKKRASLRKGRLDVVGSRQTTFRRTTGDSTTGSTTMVPSVADSSTEVGTITDEKPLPVLPPPTPVSEFGSRMTTPIPPEGFKDDHEGEHTIILLNNDRIGFPHRAKAKEGQVTPQGLWKGKLNWQWWMMPSLDMAGLSVKVSIIFSFFVGRLSKLLLSTAWKLASKLTAFNSA